MIEVSNILPNPCIFAYNRIKNTTVQDMRKLVLCIMIAIGGATYTPSFAGDESLNIAEQTIKRKIEAVYNAIHFEACSKPDFTVFEKAYRGYLNLRNSGELNTDKPVLTICDMSMSANTNRMWIIDLKSGKVLLNTFVAHGQGSGDEYANRFSNKMNSHQSSIGFYITGDTYIGEHGNSLYLHGMDKGFNHLAYKRNIVVHGADYVNDKYIANNKRLGRSWGCPAVSSEISDEVIEMIKGGTCMFIYFPQKKYIQTSYWLNKKPEEAPAIPVYAQPQQQANRG